MRNAISKASLLHLLAVGLVLASAGCGKASEASKPPVSASVPPASPEALAKRCAQHLAKMAAGDWIEAYDFLTPKERKSLPLQEYLNGKNRHRYEHPEEPLVLKTDAQQGFVLATCMWTPMHPALSAVHLAPGESLTQKLETVETWVWSDSNWFYSSSLGAAEFFAAHPDIQKPAPH